jgi:hypothetical protein
MSDRGVYINAFCHLPLFFVLVRLLSYTPSYEDLYRAFSKKNNPEQGNRWKQRKSEN